MKIHPEKKQGWRLRCKLGPNTHHHDHHTTAMFALNTCSRKSAPTVSTSASVLIRLGDGSALARPLVPYLFHPVVGARWQ